jgi:hypothetical protein
MWPKFIRFIVTAHHLFVGDSIGGTVAEFDTVDRQESRAAARINIEGIDVKIAAMAGVTPEERGPDAAAMVVKVTPPVR